MTWPLFGVATICILYGLFSGNGHASLIGIIILCTHVICRKIDEL